MEMCSSSKSRSASRTGQVELRNSLAIGILPIKFSGIVVTFNEERHLAECLAALSFCDELIVVDLGSTDRSTEIAAQFGARVIHHKWVPAVEYVREFAVNQAKNDWVIFMDPDLIFPAALVSRVCEQIVGKPLLGSVGIPYRNHFLGKPIRHGRWGGRVAYPAVFRRDAIELRAVVHRWFRFRPGFDTVRIGDSEAEMIKHYWADSIEHLYQKHRRYVSLEGKVRFDEGQRFSYWQLPVRVGLAVFSSLVLQRGFLDGKIGIYLSYFNGWWVLHYLLALRDYQRQIEKIG